jgi:hypothetical protein
MFRALTFVKISSFRGFYIYQKQEIIDYEKSNFKMVEGVVEKFLIGQSKIS